MSGCFSPHPQCPWTQPTSHSHSCTIKVTNRSRRRTLGPTAAAISRSAPCWTASKNRSPRAVDTEPRIYSKKDKYQFHLHAALNDTSSCQTGSVYMSKYVPSEHVCSDVHDHQGEPGVDHTPDRKGPAGWSDVGLIAGRHISCSGMEGTWKTTEPVRSTLSHHSASTMWSTSSSSTLNWKKTLGECSGTLSSWKRKWSNTKWNFKVGEAQLCAQLDGIISEEHLTC